MSSISMQKFDLQLLFKGQDCPWNIRLGGLFGTKITSCFIISISLRTFTFSECVHMRDVYNIKFKLQPWASIPSSMKTILRPNKAKFWNSQGYMMAYIIHIKTYICFLQACRTLALNLIDQAKAGFGNSGPVAFLPYKLPLTFNYLQCTSLRT